MTSRLVLDFEVGTSTALASKAEDHPNKSEEDTTTRKSALQWLPCRIGYDGEAKVEEYFESSRADLDLAGSKMGDESASLSSGVEQAFLRGRNLKGRYVSLEEEGYQCAVMEKSADGQGWKATQNFDGFTQWSHSTLPEPQRALEILTLANSLC